MPEEQLQQAPLGGHHQRRWIYIVTNNHVVTGTPMRPCPSLNDHRTYPAAVIGLGGFTDVVPGQNREMGLPASSVFNSGGIRLGNGSWR